MDAQDWDACRQRLEDIAHAAEQLGKTEITERAARPIRAVVAEVERLRKVEAAELARLRGEVERLRAGIAAFRAAMWDADMDAGWWVLDKLDVALAAAGLDAGDASAPPASQP